MGEHEGKPLPPLEPFELGDTKQEPDSNPPPGKHEKPAQK